MKNNIAEIFKKYRKENGLTQTELAAKLKVRDNTVAMIEQGKRQAGEKLLTKFAHISKLSLKDLIGIKVQKKLNLLLDTLPANIRPATLTSKSLHIPLLGSCSAGVEKGIYDEILDWIPIPDEVAKMYKLKKGKAFALVVDGSSMEPTLKNGELIYVRVHEDYKDLVGKVIVARINHDEDAVLKRLVKTKKGYILKSDNRKFKDIPCGSGVTIIGQVVAQLNMVE